MRDLLWVCKDGRTLLVGQMRTQHIKNAIALIQRHRAKGRRWRTRYLPRLELELEIRNMKDRTP